MSIKNYDFFKIDDSLENVYSKLFDFRAKIESVQKQLFYKELSYHFLRYIDLNSLHYKFDKKLLIEDNLPIDIMYGKIKKKESINLTLLDMLKIYTQSCLNNKETVNDFDFLKQSMVLYSYEGVTYAKCFFNSSSLFEHAFLSTFSNSSEYHYQNQCEKPDDIDEKEWQHRRDLANYISQGMAYYKGGTIFKLDVEDNTVLYNWIVDYDAILNSLPSMEKRIYNTAKHLMINEYMKSKVDNGEEYSTSLAMEASDFILNTPDGLRLIMEKEDEISSSMVDINKDNIKELFNKIVYSEVTCVEDDIDY